MQKKQYNVAGHFNNIEIEPDFLFQGNASFELQEFTLNPGEATLRYAYSNDGLVSLTNA